MQEMIKKVVRKIFLIMEVALSKVVPKKKNYWVYAPSHYDTVDGNIKYLFDYVNSAQKEISQVILMTSQNVQQDEYKNFFVDRFSIKGIIAVLRAEVIFLDAGSAFDKGKFNVVQLWHGTGYKNILFLSKRFLQTREYQQKKAENILLIPATSENDKERKAKSFVNENVFVTGSPRTDYFFTDNGIKDRREYLISLSLDGYDKIICYAPTYRDKDEFKPFSMEFLQKIQDLAEKQNFLFLLKFHPNTDLEDHNYNYPNIKHSRDYTDDTQLTLLLSDVLITDYSGIASDFVLLQRPMLFYFFDYDIYLKKYRDFYYDLKATLPGPFAQNEEELYNFIQDLSWFDEDEYQVKFKSYLNFFHKYKDNKSSERVFTKVKELLV